MIVKGRGPSSGPLPLVFLIIITGAVIVGLIYYKYQRKSLLMEKQHDLAVISYLKIKQISQWRFERLGEGQFIGDNVILVRKFSEYLMNPVDTSLKKDVVQSLKSFTENFDFSGAVLLKSNGDIKLNYPPDDSLMGDHLKSFLNDIGRKNILLSDLHTAGPVNYIHLDLIVPLIERSENDTAVIGFLALQINPEHVLFPLIQLWEIPDKSAEILLLEKDRDDVVYLNRFVDDAGTKVFLKRSLSEEKLTSAMAVQGITSTIKGVDYKNSEVVAAMNKIPGTPWYLLTKIDSREILSVLFSKMKMAVMMIILLIMASGSFLTLRNRNKRADYYKEKYEDELNRLAVVKHFDYILKYANDIILLIDSNLNIVEANDRALEYYQYEREEFIGMKLENLRSIETRRQMSENLNIVEDRGFSTFETVHMKRDKTTFPIEISARVVMIEGYKYYQSIGRDITDRKRVENTLRDSENRFRKVFEEGPFSMLMTGKDFLIMRANSSFCRMIGYSEDELKSFTFRNFTHPDHLGEDETELLKLTAGEIPVYKTEKRYFRKDGTLVWGATTVSIIRNANEEVQFYVVMIEDITSRKKAQSELIAAKEKAEEGDRLKTAFLHNVSHEIRTPMNAIIGFSSLLKEPDITRDEEHQYIDIITQSGGQLLSIINDIVDIANVESGQAKVNLTTLELNAALYSLNEQFRINLKQNISINLETSLTNDDSVILTDSTKLIQILSNLINNSIKFTQQGSIDFGYILKHGFLEFFVKDTGIGISLDYQSRIFDRFYQVDNAISRQFSGTGLGLSICKGYVELLGGTIRVESEPGTGTEFYFTIPYNRV